VLRKEGKEGVNMDTDTDREDMILDFRRGFRALGVKMDKRTAKLCAYFYVLGRADQLERQLGERW
jgi:hypothetical protein